MNERTTIRDARREDGQAIKRIAVASGLFAEEEVGFLDEPLSGFFEGTLEGHRWLVAQDSGRGLVAGAYFAPEPFADRMWNLYFIAVDPGAQGRGVGGALLEHVETELRAAGEGRARTLVVETSSTDGFQPTRAFYLRHGFVEEARIRQFYGPEDHKVVFWKSLVETRSLQPD